MSKKVLIAVRLCSSTLLLPSLFLFVCHSNDELSMRCSSGCKLSDLTDTDTFEPCRLLMHSNKSFSLSRCITHKEPLSVRKGSSQNNFPSLLKAEESKQIRNAHSPASSQSRRCHSGNKTASLLLLFQSHSTPLDKLVGPNLLSYGTLFWVIWNFCLTV